MKGKITVDIIHPIETNTDYIDQELIFDWINDRLGGYRINGNELRFERIVTFSGNITYELILKEEEE